MDETRKQGWGFQGCKAPLRIEPAKGETRARFMFLPNLIFSLEFSRVRTGKGNEDIYLIL